MHLSETQLEIDSVHEVSRKTTLNQHASNYLVWYLVSLYQETLVYHKSCCRGRLPWPPWASRQIRFHYKYMQMQHNLSGNSRWPRASATAECFVVVFPEWGPASSRSISIQYPQRPGKKSKSYACSRSTSIQYPDTLDQMRIENLTSCSSGCILSD